LHSNTTENTHELYKTNDEKKKRKDDQNTLFPEIILSKLIVALALSTRKFKALQKHHGFKIKTKLLKR
jgi:hypothetical protein